MEHKGTVTIGTERLTLRRFTEEDAVKMYENWASDPEVTRFMTWPPHADPEVTRAVIGSWIPEYENPSYYN